MYSSLLRQLGALWLSQGNLIQIDDIMYPWKDSLDTFILPTNIIIMPTVVLIVRTADLWHNESYYVTTYLKKEKMSVVSQTVYHGHLGIEENAHGC